MTQSGYPGTGDRKSHERLMNVELITIGAELLAGRTLNTNAHFVGDRLGTIGVSLARQISIPDDHDTIVATIRDSLQRADWVIVSGGLGPTNDDVTKKALARVFNRSLVFHDDLLARLKERYERLGRSISPLLDTQAVQPADAELVPNDLGTAVGIVLSEHGKTLVAVPGVPREMHPMVEDHIVPRIAAALKIPVRTLTWSTVGWPESRLYEAIEPVITAYPEITVAFLPSELGVRLRFSADGADAESALERFANTVRPLIAKALYAEDETDLEALLGQILIDRKMTIALAESCTGGLIAKRLTDVGGASAYVKAGIVAYSNEAKIELLGVDPALIEQHGAVSGEVARAMAEGALARTGADCAIGLTGIAGPTGGTEDKPVGLVWIALALKGRASSARDVRLLGSREMVRARAAQAALNLLRQRLQSLDAV